MMFVDLYNIEDQGFYDLFGMEHEKGNVIEFLLLNCTLPDVLSRLIWSRLYQNAFTNEEADEIIQYLKDNQLDRIEAGHNYSQTDIKNKLNTIKDE